jgi:hypothetical protein
VLRTLTLINQHDKYRLCCCSFQQRGLLSQRGGQVTSLQIIAAPVGAQYQFKKNRYVNFNDMEQLRTSLVSGRQRMQVVYFLGTTSCAGM